jgi:hypothetical protein
MLVSEKDFRASEINLLNQFESLCIFLDAMNKPDDLIKTKDARKILGISPLKMSKLLKKGTIRHFPDPLDERVKLVSKSEVLGLMYKRSEAA